MLPGLCQDLQPLMVGREPQVRPETGPVSEPLSLGGSLLKLKYEHTFLRLEGHVLGHSVTMSQRHTVVRAQESCSIQTAHLHTASSQCRKFSRFSIRCLPLSCVSEGLVLFCDGILTACPPIDACQLLASGWRPAD